MRTFVLVALFAAAGTAPAQTPSTAIRRVVMVNGVPQVVGAAAAVVPPEASPAADAAAATPPAESPRLTRLKAQTFDRRPSAVLKAWAPVKPDPDKAAPTKDPTDEALDKEIVDFTRAVTLGDWPKVKAYLATLPDEEAVAAYRQLLHNLSQPTNAGPGGMRMPDDTQGIPPQMLAQLVPGAQQQAERNRFGIDDLFGLAAAAPSGTNPEYLPARTAVAGPAAAARIPEGLDKTHLPMLSGVLREVIAGGTLPEVAVARLKVETAKPEGAALTRRQVAKLLVAANQAVFAGDFLPTPDDAQKSNDLEGLNLLSRHFLALNAKEAKAGGLERAWAAVQAVLLVPDGSREQQQEALLRAVELAPRLKEQLGQTWLDESFTKAPERGMAILATVGTLVSQGLSGKPFLPDDRLNALKLMQTAVDALLKAAPDKATAWRPTLTLLADGWLKEAEFSRQYDQSTSANRLRRDVYGNIYYGGMDEDGMQSRMMQRPDMPRPVATAEVLRARPSDAWVAAIDDTFRPRLADTLARLHLKADEEDKAFPLIEQLAPAQPENAKELVREFVRVWIRNHDQNAARNERRYSWFFFAFEQRAEGIPLTRSKQERNLQDLAKWAERIRKLPGAGDLDDELLVKAFTACHSSAEVYKTEAIELVFGPVATLKPRTLAGLAQQMRGNLAGLWRDPNEQVNKKTNRRKKDLEAEVLRGYAVARGVVEDALAKFPDHWTLLAARASLLHDEINYRQELNKSSDFSAKRNEAFANFKLSAEKYAEGVKALPEDEQSNTVYDQWFAAGLGAVDLGMITEDKQPDKKQPPLIRAAIEGLPGDLAEKHMNRFANGLFTRMSGAKPHVKFNYLKAGFEIVGDHKQAAEAKKLFDYYKDLVTEIKLDAVVDGPAAVGHGRPFGVFVNLRHTRDIERESGGFGRYLQNQNSMAYAYNYGRPTTDYRDRFEAAAREALKEHFDVMSVTFQDDKVQSRALPEFGWRYTPYAYLLLKAKGPEVDRLPPMRLDMDFLDTSGFVVLPVETPAVPVDCKADRPEPRPVDKLTVTQTLDERQADKGALLLEVKAVGVGLVPDLDALCTIAPAGFEVAKVEDQGVAVKKFDDAADGNAVLSERAWQVTLKGLDGQPELPKAFRFGAVKVPAKEVLFQRYVDADLSTVGEEITLEKVYGSQSHLWMWALAAGGLLLAAAVAGLVTALRGRRPAAVVGPVDATPFTVLELLRDVRDTATLTPHQRAELDAAIAEVERHYFADDPGGRGPDLRAVAAKWTGRGG